MLIYWAEKESVRVKITFTYNLFVEAKTGFDIAFKKVINVGFSILCDLP